MVDKLDESIGNAVSALENKGLLNNSIVIFASDNGASPDGLSGSHGSNWPLRGVFEFLCDPTLLKIWLLK